LTNKPSLADLQIAVDNAATVTINNQTVVQDSSTTQANNWNALRTYDVTSALSTGSNNIQITVTNVNNGSSVWALNPAGVLARLTMQYGFAPSTNTYYSRGGTSTDPLGLTGNAAPGASVGIHAASDCSDSALGTATADPSGSWFVALTGLSPGTYTYYTSSTLSVLGTSTTACSGPITVVIDRTAPSSTVTFPSGYVRSTDWTAGCGAQGVGICGTFTDTGGSGPALVLVALEKVVSSTSFQFWDPNGTGGGTFDNSGAWLYPTINPTPTSGSGATATYSWFLPVPTASMPDGTYAVVSGAIDNAGNVESDLQYNLCGSTDPSQLDSCYQGGLAPPGGGLAPPSGGLAPLGGGLAPPGSGLSSLGSGLAPPGSGLAPPGGGLAPMGGGLAPLGGGLAPPSGGLAPPGGGLAPPSGGLAPLGGGLAPPGSGLAPPGGGLAPPSGGLAPLGSGSGTSNIGSVVMDNVSPVVSHFVVDGQQSDVVGDNPVNIDPASTVHIRFNEGMKCSTVNGTTVTVATVPTTSASTLTAPSCDAGDQTFLNASFTGLQPNTFYSITVSGATDLAGNVIGTTLPSTPGTAYPLTWHFTTAALSPVAPTDTDHDGIPDAWDGATIHLANGQTIDTTAWGFNSGLGSVPASQSKDLCVVETYMNGTAANGTAYNQQISQAANADIVNAFARHHIHLVIFEGDAAHSAGLPGTPGGPTGLPAYTGPWYGGQLSVTGSGGNTTSMVDPVGNVTSAQAFDWTSAYTGSSTTPVQASFDQIRNQDFVPTGLSQFCHFALIAHSLGGTQSTGSSRGIDGSDLVIGLGGTDNGVGTELQQAGTLMHELGHNLGLHHGGSEPAGTPLPPDINTNYKSNYLSVMNYSYQFTGVLLNSNAHIAGSQACTVGSLNLYCLLDYSEGALQPLDKTNLLETAGLAPGSTWPSTFPLGDYAMKHRCPTVSSPPSPSGYDSVVVTRATGAIDWNCNGATDSGSESVGTYPFIVNGDPAGQTLLGGGLAAAPQTNNDWNNLNFLVGTVGLGQNGTGSQGPQPTSSTIDIDNGQSGGTDSVTNVAKPEQTSPLNPYQKSGTCDGDAGHQILQPVNADNTSVFKAGSTVPLKFRVCDVTGTSVGPTAFAASVVTSFLLTSTSADTNAVVNETPVSTTPDTSFRWDSTNQQWIFNLSTKSLAAGTKYTYTIGLNDGSKITVIFALR
jgi:hypothetical protein